MSTETIKQQYSDALYWAISPKTKKEVYHLTRLQESILRKLIHYSLTNEKISYSNLIIAEHTFLEEETLRKEIPKIAKKGYCSTAVTKIFDDGEYKSVRTIFIKWDKLAFVLSQVVHKEKIPIETDESINEAMSNEQIDNYNEIIAKDENPETKTYSEATFKLGNGKTVKVMLEHLDYFNSIQDSKGIINSLKREISQYMFDRFLIAKIKNNLNN